MQAEVRGQVYREGTKAGLVVLHGLRVQAAIITQGRTLKPCCELLRIIQLSARHVRAQVQWRDGAAYGVSNPRFIGIAARQS